MTEQRERRGSRSGTPIATRAQAAARQIRKVSRLSASAFGSFGRAALIRCFDPGYDPDAANGAHEQFKKTTIEIKDLSVRYGRRIALKNITGAFAAGSMTAIVGPNGAGKSTLLKAIAGSLCEPGATDNERRRPAVWLICRNRVRWSAAFPVRRRLVALGAWRHFGAFRNPPADIASRV